MNKSSVLVSFSQDSCHKWWFSFGIRWTGSNDILNDWMLGGPTSGAVCSGKASEYLQRRSGSAEDAENGENPIRFVIFLSRLRAQKREETNVWKWFLYVIVL